jgi:hypothetical protein
VAGSVFERALSVARLSLAVPFHDVIISTRFSRSIISVYAKFGSSSPFERLRRLARTRCQHVPHGLVGRRFVFK